MTSSATVRVRRFTASRDHECATGCGTPVATGEQGGYIGGIPGTACAACCDNAEQVDEVAIVGAPQASPTGPIHQLSTPAVPSPGNARGYPPDVIAELDEFEHGTPPHPHPNGRLEQIINTHVVHRSPEAEVVAQLVADGATRRPTSTPQPPAEDQPQQPIADLTPWAGEAVARGGDPELVGAELLDAFREGILAGDIRGRQKEIGPSGLGHPCSRSIAYLLADVPPTGNQATPWRQAVGTAMHERGALWAHQANTVRGTRWLTDLRVDVGELYPGRRITGTLDFLDVMTGTVVDLKVPGTTAMKTYAKNKPESPQYRVQVHTYGRGVMRAGFLPSWVAVLRVSPARELAESIYKVEPFNEQVAVDALTRVGGIARMVDALGARAAAALPPTDHYCTRCDWFQPGATDLTAGCPGAPGAVKPRRDQLDLLVS